MKRIPRNAVYLGTDASGACVYFTRDSIIAKYQRKPPYHNTICCFLLMLHRRSPSDLEAYRRGERELSELFLDPRLPFSHEFASLHGDPRYRFKPVERVVAEIRALPKSGYLTDKMKPLDFVDDNFISQRGYTKQLLQALVPLHDNGELREWSAETTVNVTKDEELLDLFARAGCSTLIIGFESISEATLLAMDKKVNFCLEYQEALARIHRRGMSVVGNFIVGFDTDSLSVFRDTLQFIDD